MTVVMLSLLPEDAADGGRSSGGKGARLSGEALVEVVLTDGGDLRRLPLRPWGTAQRRGGETHNPRQSLRVKGYTWTGEQSALEAKCLAERSGRVYLPVQTQERFMDALQKTLGCPMVTRVFREERVSLRTSGELEQLGQS